MQAQINSLQTEIYEKKSFLKQAETSIKDFIRDKVGIEDIPSRYERYRLYFQKEKLIYQNLNKCLLRGNFIDGEVWIPEEKYPEVQDGLLRITRENNSRLTAFLSDPETIDIAPPTYIKTNDLTAPFQMIVNEYGVPRYREANPALFAIVTFPFLFGVMFGDIGHGLTLFLAALYLVLKYDDLVKLDPAMKNILKVRYLLLSMGFFAFYCGWMYNDFVSLPLGIFGTCYHEVKINDVTHIERIDKNCVYPFGIDPKWYVARNELSFLNSLKMKTSVIFGIIQMCFGIVLKGINAIYFGSMVDFFFEFIPQLIFMAGLFGYMIIMIFIKWTTDWSADTSKAPSVISMLLQIFLGGGSVGKDVIRVINLFSLLIKSQSGVWMIIQNKRHSNFIS